MLDARHFLRNALFNQLDKNQGACWHRPVIVRDMQTRLGDVIRRLKVAQERPDDDVIDNDLILVWGSQRRIITESDLLGRLLRGIATVEAGKRRTAIGSAIDHVEDLILVWHMRRRGVGRKQAAVTLPAKYILRVFQS